MPFKYMIDRFCIACKCLLLYVSLMQMGCNALQVASLWTVPSDRRWQFGSRVGENGMNCGLSKRYPLHRIYGFPLTRRTHVIVKGSVLM